MKIAIIGSGYVGTTLAGMLSNAQYKVMTIDVDKEKVKKLNSGKAPFYEIGLDNLIASGVQSGNLSASNNYTKIKDANIVFSCVGTPDNPDGSSDLSYVEAATKSAAKFLKSGAIYVQKSTVPVGTGKKLSALLPPGVSYVSNPEFLREGSAIRDSLLFDRIVAGGTNNQATEEILSLHRNIEGRSQAIAKIAGIDIIDDLQNHNGEYITTTLESAELIKVTANAFLALKISFANSIAKLCDAANANIKDVMDAIGSDRRIGKAFLNAGRGYGGGCFPKDVSGLIASSLEHGVDMPIMTAAADVNQSMPGYIINKVGEHYGAFTDKKITVLGLTFKAGTSDTRRSPAIKIANRLSKLGAKVTVYDPAADGGAKIELEPDIVISPTLKTSVRTAQVIFIATNWSEFSIENLQDALEKKAVIVDCMNSLDSQAVKSLGFDYIGVGVK